VRFLKGHFTLPDTYRPFVSYHCLCLLVLPLSLTIIFVSYHYLYPLPLPMSITITYVYYHYHVYYHCLLPLPLYLSFCLAFFPTEHTCVCILFFLVHRLKFLPSKFLQNVTDFLVCLSKHRIKLDGLEWKFPRLIRAAVVVSCTRVLSEQGWEFGYVRITVK
jgi:hypothetical protein